MSISNEKLIIFTTLLAKTLILFLKIAQPLVLNNLSGSHLQKKNTKKNHPFFFLKKEDAKHVFYLFGLIQGLAHKEVQDITRLDCRDC